ncbi:MAG: ABC transporter permease [Gemmatimonadales bacterium]
MNRWLLRRGADACVTALLAAVALVVLVHLMPGDPLTALVGENGATPEQLAALTARWGTDRPLLTKVVEYFAALFHGDLGYSMTRGIPVTTVLRERLGPTLLLGSLTLLVDFTIGLALGLWTALRPESWRARAVSALSILGYAIPSFVAGMLLVWLFGIKLRWLPVAGYSDVLLPMDADAGTVLLDRIKHLILPLAAMVIATIAVPLRQQRAAALAVVNAPWVRAARARGVSPAAVAWRHCWRPALTPVVTLFGLWLPMLVAGAVFIEGLFSWPGLGSLIAEATSARDVPLVVGAGLLLVIAVQLGSLVADVLYRVVDPVQRES